MTANQTISATVRIFRSKLYPIVARPGPAWRWTYSYAVGDRPAVDYGTGLASLRGMLKRHFPGSAIQLDWQTD
jgi:hypothetical protein